VTSYPNIDEVVTVHVSQNHPFLDGNKRVAVTVTAAFLKVNGYKLAVA
jgi:prophage maintenance system killer protein